jgi:hypothetical protein
MGMMQGDYVSERRQPILNGVEMADPKKEPVDHVMIALMVVIIGVVGALIAICFGG